MDEYVGKFGYSIRITGDSYYIEITAENDHDNVSVLLYPSQAKELAKQLMLQADIVDQKRKERE